MNTALACLVIAVVSYLLGSLNFSIIISKLFLKKDIRNFGSGNAGSTNSLRVMGAGKTIFVILGDIIKAVVAINLTRLFVANFNFVDVELAMSISAAACILGHTYPVFFGFRGGKGVLTTAAVMACIDIRIFLIAITVFIVIVALTKYVSLGSIIAVWTLPVLFALFYGFNLETIEYFVLLVLIAVFVTILHRSNIKRLLSGTENKLKFKK